jgi:hypothetical protein
MEEGEKGEGRQRGRQKGKNITIYKIISEKLNGRSRNALPIFYADKIF